MFWPSIWFDRRETSQRFYLVFASDLVLNTKCYLVLALDIKCYLVLALDIKC